MNKFLLILVSFLFSFSAFALSSTDITIERTTAPSFTTDSNTPCTEGPRAAYVGFKIINTSGATLSDVSISLGGFSPVDCALAGGQAASQYIGALAPGESDVIYWYVTYPCVHNTACTITATASDKNPGTKTYTTTITTRSSISANAGGLINTTFVGAGAVIGQVIPFTVTYSFGNANVGDEYNIQPSGNLSFDAQTFQLVNTEIVSSVIPNITAGDKDKLFYIGGLKNGSGNLVTVRYFFQVKKSNMPGTSARPYAVQTSGNQIKYTGNYSTAIVNSMPATSASPLVLTLDCDKVVAPVCDTLTYKVVIRNMSNFKTNLDQIKMRLPEYVSYVGIAAGSEATENMMISYPSANATNYVRWIGGKNAAEFPYKEFYIPENDSIVLLLKAIASCNIPINSPRNATAIAYAGLDSTNSASKTVCLNCAAGFPVEFTNFNAQIIGNQEVMLTWETASEKNNDYFEVEQSVDAKDFFPIGRVEGAGNSTTLQQYEYKHDEASFGTSYYRIKQVDFDGKVSYSEINEVNNKTIEWISANVYPNPASNYVNIQIGTKVETAIKVQMLNLQGAVVKEWFISQDETDTNLELNLEGITKGLYFMKIIPLKNISRTLTHMLAVQ
ncbi:MAG: T9SS type A sorting domain-containing protein [Bacteroidia bacterium]